MRTVQRSREKWGTSRVRGFEKGEVWIMARLFWPFSTICRGVSGATSCTQAMTQYCKRQGNRMANMLCCFWFFSGARAVVYVLRRA